MVTAPSISLPSISGSMSAFDDGDLTTVDVVPLFDAAWEPGSERSLPRLARTPHLDDPPPPPTFEAARGSTVRVSPVHVSLVHVPPPPPARLATLKLAAWAAALLAGGVGLGMAVVSLMT